MSVFCYENGISSLPLLKTIHIKSSLALSFNQLYGGIFIGHELSIHLSRSTTGKDVEKEMWSLMFTLLLKDILLCNVLYARTKSRSLLRNLCIVVVIPCNHRVLLASLISIHKKNQICVSNFTL